MDFCMTGVTPDSAERLPLLPTFFSVWDLERREKYLAGGREGRELVKVDWSPGWRVNPGAERGRDI